MKLCQMKNIHQRKKDPELIRAKILDGAVMLASKNGIYSVSIQDVANYAGVTKGGVFHHFQSKNILLDAMFIHLLNILDNEIENLINNDLHKIGKFSRAYIKIILKIERNEFDKKWAALLMSKMTNDIFLNQWNEWINNKIKKNKPTESYFYSKLLISLTNETLLENRNYNKISDRIKDIKEKLISLSYKLEFD